MSNLIRTPSNSLTAFIDPSVVGSHAHLSGSIASVPGTFPSCVEGGDEVTFRVDTALEQPHEKQCRFLSLGGVHLRGGAIVACALEHALQHVQVGYLEIFVDKVGRHERPPFVGAKAFSPYATAPASNAIDRVTVRFKLQLSKAFGDTLRVSRPQHVFGVSCDKAHPRDLEVAATPKRAPASDYCSLILVAVLDAEALLKIFQRCARTFNSLVIAVSFSDKDRQVPNQSEAYIHDRPHLILLRLDAQLTGDPKVTGWGRTQPDLQLAPGWLSFARFSRRLVGSPITRMVLVLSRILIGLLIRLIFVLPLLVLIVWHVLLPPRRGVRRRANTPSVESFRFCPAPHSNTDGSPETENGSERHFPEHSAILGGDFELLPVYNIIGQNLLSQYLPRSLDGFLVGSVERGELSSFRIFFEGTRLSDVEVIPGHVVSIHSSRLNQQDHAPFPPPAQDNEMPNSAGNQIRTTQRCGMDVGSDDRTSPVAPPSPQSREVG